MPARIVVIGGSAAGMGAAGAAKQSDPQAQVTVFTNLPDAAYSPFGVPAVREREIPGFDHLMRQTRDHYREHGLDIRYETHVESVDLAKGEVTGEWGRLPFDRLVIGTGCVAAAPDIPGADLEGVYTVRDRRLAQAWDEGLGGVRVAVVAGARPDGIEIATALARRGIETHLVDPRAWPMAEIADPDIMAPAQEAWRDLGVQLHADTTIESVSGTGRVTAVQTSRGELPADMVVLGTQKVPDATLATQAGIKTGVAGGIMVDPRMVTSVPEVYAAGDCAELPPGFTRIPVPVLSGSHAHAQGKVAGANATGAAGDARAYQPLYVPWTLAGENWAIGGVCFGETLASTLGIPFVLGVADGISRARYYPGFRKIRVKLLADPKTLQVIGAQLVGSEGVKERCDLLSLAARKAFTLDDLAWMENVYSPAMGALNEPIALAAQDGLRRLGRS